MRMRAGRLFGLRIRPGQGFYFAGVDCLSGQALFRQSDQKGYQTGPKVRLRQGFHGQHLVAEIKDRQDFELKALDTRNGKVSHAVRVKGVGDFGLHGRASATVQNGCLVIHGQNTLKIAAPQSGATK
jgi:hypothetical protein